ncbi:MAG TPA: hypothetical protein VF874_10095, partial [Mycobacterium sp.]
RVRAQRMQRFVNAHQHDPGDRGVYRIALANPNTDRVLADREWGQVAERFVARLGADKGLWEATRHDRHHIHLTIRPGPPERVASRKLGMIFRRGIGRWLGRSWLGRR